ncbi:MAG: tRNA epoxyqueuosine(34) reductase QueG [Luteimonas sp.]|nr:tRNA epoxyqueuosine(34) reductase QueG [Luteimonas sp.]
MGQVHQLDAPRLVQQLRAWADELGLSQIGIAGVDLAAAEPGLRAWLDAGFHGSMAYMARHGLKRARPAELVPGTVSVIGARLAYLPAQAGGDWRAHEWQRLARPADAAVSVYARGRDYHKVLRKPLIALARFLDAFGVETPSYASVDSGPVMERAWAERAGVGWVGKNSLVLRRDIGSWFFLGTVVTEVSLAPDAPMGEHCGTCRACLDACPTGAIVADGVVDSNRCISYQTIENREEIPSQLHSQLAGWVFGCDICQDVCPWNRFARPTTEPGFAARSGQTSPDLDELLKLDERRFDARFAGTAIRRAKWRGMVRNARIALRNAGKT